MSKKFCVENNNYTMFSFYLQLFVASIIFQERIERKAKEWQFSVLHFNMFYIYHTQICASDANIFMHTIPYNFACVYIICFVLQVYSDRLRYLLNGRECDKIYKGNAHHFKIGNVNKYTTLYTSYSLRSYSYIIEYMYREWEPVYGDWDWTNLGHAASRDS